MSRFWAGGSSSESENESVEESDEEIVNQTKAGGKFAGAFDSDSESEDEVRVVRSQKDKSWETMLECINKIKSAMKINDWSIISDEFDNVNKIVEKSKMLILKNGIPKFYIRMLAELEDFLTLTLKDKEGIKKLKPMVNKSLNRMKNTVRKHNRTYEKDIENFRAHPENYVDSEKEEDSSDESDSDEEESEESESEEEEEEDEKDEDESESDDEEEKVVSKKKGTKPIRGDDDDSSQDSWPSESESSESEISEDETGRPELKGREKWVKKETAVVVAKKVVKKAPNKVQKKILEEKATAVLNANAAKVAKAQWKLEDNITEELLEKKLTDLVAARGRKRSDIKSVLRQLEVLSKMAVYFGPRKEILTLMHRVSAMFDSHRLIDDFMDLETWRNCHACMTKVLVVLHANPKLVLALINPEDAAVVNLSNVKAVEVDSSKTTDGNILRIVGSIESFLIRLQDEYTKGLQQINPHTQEYVVRLSDEAHLLEVVESAQKYYIRVGDLRAASNMALMRVEHMYYKHDTIAFAVHRAHAFSKKWGKYSDMHPAATGKTSESIPVSDRNVTRVHPAAYLGTPTVTLPVTKTPTEILEELCTFIYRQGDDRCKTRALLCAVYHHSLHNRYYHARDLFLMSHIQDTIEKADTSTQILYNRALVTLGLSAFRLGLIQKAHDSLSGVCSGRVRELLAQGQSRWHDRDSDQENAERRRQMPYHMHINPDLLDCCHLICSMLLELPLLAGLPGAQNQRFQFRKHLQAYNRQVFTGPPENTREHVLSSAKALLMGDWQKSSNYLLNLDVWNLIPNDEGSAVKAMLGVKIKEEALRIHLISNGDNYDSIALSHLCEMFEMDATNVRRIISKMIFNQEIYGAWSHNPVEVLVIYKVVPTVTQQLAQQLADKVSGLVENNERILDPLTSSYGYKDEWSSNPRARGNTNADAQAGQRGGKKQNISWKSSATQHLNAPNTRAYQSQVAGNRAKTGRVSTVWGSGNAASAAGAAPNRTASAGVNKPKTTKKVVGWNN